jgi:hypothetical protein
MKCSASFVGWPELMALALAELERAKLNEDARRALRDGPVTKNEPMALLRRSSCKATLVDMVGTICFGRRCPRSVSVVQPLPDNF